MICQFNIGELKQKELYYKIQNTFNIENSNTHTYAGIYIIIKNDYPAYVGQSKNLASRIATHLKGKYAEADMILAFDIRELGWTDFHDRNTTSRQEILDIAEKYIIREMKPTENIIADFDFDIDNDCKPNFYIDCPDITIRVANPTIEIVTCIEDIAIDDPVEFFMLRNDNLKEKLNFLNKSDSTKVREAIISHIFDISGVSVIQNMGANSRAKGSK